MHRWQHPRRRIVPALMVLGAFVLVRPSAAQILTGEQSGDRFGYAVAPAGDLNDDGYDDFLVGAPDRDTPAVDAGAVYVFLGRLGVMPGEPDLVLSGQIGGDHFGYAVAGGGDVDGDGYDDFLVGAPGSDVEGAGAGTVYLFLGGAVLDATADAAWHGTLPGARFGAALAAGFDFDHDGRADFAVGAPDHNGNGLRAGEVTVFVSEPAGLPVARFRIEGDQPNWSLGFSLDGAGDVDGDGFDDVIAGAPQSFDQNSGRAVIWFGQEANQPAPARIVLAGEVGTDRFGWDVAGAGDITGDNRSEVLVGAPQQGLDNGAVYLFSGGNPMNAVFDWKVTGSTGGDRLGAAVHGGFDLNGDGDPDVAAGAPGNDDLGSQAGRVQVYYGGAGFNTTVDRVLTPLSPAPTFEASDAFGSAVGFVGSFNGDEFDELVVGAPAGNAPGGGEAGYANFVTDPGSFTPVRLTGFEVEVDGAGAVRLRWSLAGIDELGGLRVERGAGGEFATVAGGRLAPPATGFRDLEPPRGRVVYRLMAVLRDGAVEELGRREIVVEPGTVLAAVTNPFRGELILRVGHAGGRLRVEVFDAAGRLVAGLHDEDAPPGTAAVRWDGAGDRGAASPPGIYFVRARAPGGERTLRVIRLP